jgi:hypothetical protein
MLITRNKVTLKPKLNFPDDKFFPFKSDNLNYTTKYNYTKNNFINNNNNNNTFGILNYKWMYYCRNMLSSDSNSMEKSFSNFEKLKNKETNKFIVYIPGNIPLNSTMNILQFSVFWIPPKNFFDLKDTNLNEIGHFIIEDEFRYFSKIRFSLFGLLKTLLIENEIDFESYRMINPKFEIIKKEAFEKEVMISQEFVEEFAFDLLNVFLPNNQLFRNMFITYNEGIYHRRINFGTLLQNRYSTSPLSKIIGEIRIKKQTGSIQDILKDSEIKKDNNIIKEKTDFKTINKKLLNLNRIPLVDLLQNKNYFHLFRFRFISEASLSPENFQIPEIKNGSYKLKIIPHPLLPLKSFWQEYPFTMYFHWYYDEDDHTFSGFFISIKNTDPLFNQFGKKTVHNAYLELYDSQSIDNKEVFDEGLTDPRKVFRFFYVFSKKENLWYHCRLDKFLVFLSKK